MSSFDLSSLSSGITHKESLCDDGVGPKKGISVFRRGMPFLVYFVFDHDLGVADH